MGRNENEPMAGEIKAILTVAFVVICRERKRQGAEFQGIDMNQACRAFMESSVPEMRDMLASLVERNADADPCKRITG